MIKLFIKVDESSVMCCLSRVVPGEASKRTVGRLINSERQWSFTDRRAERDDDADADSDDSEAPIKYREYGFHVSGEDVVIDARVSFEFCRFCCFISSTLTFALLPAYKRKTQHQTVSF